MARDVWIGIVVPLSLRRRTMWLPRCLTLTNPSFSKIFNASAPDIRGSSGICGEFRSRWNIKSRQKRSIALFNRKFFQVKFGGFLKVCQRLFDCFSLTDSTYVRAFSDIPFVFFMDYCRICHFSLSFVLRFPRLMVIPIPTKNACLNKARIG